MNIKNLLKEDGFSCKYQAKTYGGTYSSPCPWCEGEDRFRCWPENPNGGNWYCQQCERSGGVIKYLMEHRGMDYHDACLYSGITPASNRLNLRRLRSLQSEIWTPSPPVKSPNKQWQVQGNNLVKSSKEYLWRDCCINIREELYNRGLKDAAINQANLGWNPTDFYCQREKWGLPGKLKDDGNLSKLWIPAGLVIPFINNNQIQNIKIRRSDPLADYKYYLLPGSSNTAMVLGNGTAAMIVESELDAILLNQEAGDLIVVVALGSVKNKPDTVVTDMLGNADIVLVALDSDEAGAKASWGWWLKQFPNATRWPTPFGKDPSAAYQSGLSLKAWVTAGITSENNDKTSIDKTPVTASTADYNIISDDNSLKEFLTTLKDSKAFVVNVIPTGTDPFKDNIRLIQLSCLEIPVISIDLEKLQKDTAYLLKDLFNGAATKVFHNAKTQLKFIQNAGLYITGPFFDTMLAAQLLSAGLKAKEYSLSALSKEYSLEKNSQDVELIKQLAKILIPELKQAGLSETAQLEFECIKAVVEMELNGILLDTEKLETAKQKFALVKELLSESLNKELGPINLNSQAQLMEALKSKGININNTKQETLMPLIDKHPFIDSLILYRKAAHKLSLINNLTEHVHPKTERAHPEYNQIGAPTGRLSCFDPNLQGIPRGKEFRSCFMATPGHKLIIGDYSQIELRIVAEISKDARMIEAYKKGEDLHRLTASLVTQKSQITKQERQAAKAVNFGLIYAMGAKGLMEYAQNTYGVSMTLQQAETFIFRFFEAYQGVSEWHRKVRETETREARTLSNRRRIWDGIPKITELLNTPVQGTSADITKKALSLLAGISEDMEFKIIGSVHDEIIIECPDEKSDHMAAFLKEAMIEAGKAYLKDVPVDVDVSVADNWFGK